MSARVNGPRLKTQLKVTFETCTFKIDSITLTKLKDYCMLINSKQSYVIRETLNYLFESDSTIIRCTIIKANRTNSCFFLPTQCNKGKGAFRRRERLGGPLKYYLREAA